MKENRGKFSDESIQSLKIDQISDDRRNGSIQRVGREISGLKMWDDVDLFLSKRRKESQGLEIHQGSNRGGNRSWETSIMKISGVFFWWSNHPSRWSVTSTRRKERRFLAQICEIHQVSYGRWNCSDEHVVRGQISGFHQDERRDESFLRNEKEVLALVFWDKKEGNHKDWRLFKFPIEDGIDPVKALVGIILFFETKSKWMVWNVCWTKQPNSGRKWKKGVGEWKREKE